MCTICGDIPGLRVHLSIIVMLNTDNAKERIFTPLFFLKKELSDSANEINVASRNIESIFLRPNHIPRSNGTAPTKARSDRVK
jgi:hypothetical protein